nr:MAG TPA: hypothetical protein [Caudoviricetes sp.]
MNIFEKIIGKPFLELGEEQPEDSLCAVNQKMVNGEYIYGFNLQNIFYNSGDTTNQIDKYATDDDIIGDLYLERTVKPADSKIDEVDYYYSLNFVVSDKFRNKWQNMMDEYVKGLLHKIYTENGDTYEVRFEPDANFEYDERYDKDGTDKFDCSIIILIVKSTLVYKANSSKFYYITESGEEDIPAVSVSESRTTNTESVTLINKDSNIYYPHDTDYNLSFTLPLIRGTELTKKLLKYKKDGTNSVLIIKHKDEVDSESDDNWTKSFIISGFITQYQLEGTIYYNLGLRRYDE